jgi:hypothetical protein
MEIKYLEPRNEKLIYVLIFLLFAAGAFYGSDKYPPYFDYDSATMSIFVNNLSYNGSYDFGFKSSNEFQDVYRQYWAAYFLPTSIPLSLIQTSLSIPPFNSDMFLKIISLAIGILGCFFASLLLPQGEPRSRGARLFLIFVSLYAPVSFLYFRTAVINILLSFMLFWAAIYIFYLFVQTGKNRYLYGLAPVLAYYGENAYLHIAFLPLIFLCYIAYKKHYLKLLKNKHVYLSAALTIVLYTGSMYVLAIRYDDSHDSFTQKTGQFLKLRGGSLSWEKLRLNLLTDKGLKYVNQHVAPQYDTLGDRSRDDRLWTFNDVLGPWQVLYALFIIGVFISIFSGNIDDVTALFLIISGSIVLLCFTVSFPEGRYLLPLVPCYAFFMLKTVNIMCSKFNMNSKLNSLIYLIIVLVLSLHTYSLLTGSYNKFSLKYYHHLYGLKQGIEYIQNHDQAGNPILYSDDFNDESLLYNRLYSNFRISLVPPHELLNILGKSNDVHDSPNIYLLARKSTLSDLTPDGFLYVRFREEGSGLPNQTSEGFLLKRLVEYDDEYVGEPMCLFKLAGFSPK